MYSKTEKAILDWLYTHAENLPITKDSQNVEWLYTTPHGIVFGLTNEQAQSITIIAERCGRCGERFFGGFLTWVRGRNFSKWDYFNL